MKSPSSEIQSEQRCKGMKISFMIEFFCDNFDVSEKMD